MKFYSENLKKFYDTLEECKLADTEYIAQKDAETAKKAQKAEERKARAKEVEAAYKAFIEARDAYDKALTDFLKDFGSFHMTIKEPNKTSVYDVFEKLFTW